jgi:hypothetical protein
MSAIPASNGETGLEKKIDEVKLETGAQNTTASSSVAASLSEKPTSGPLKTPIVQPVEGITAPPPIALTAEQQTKYDSSRQSNHGRKSHPRRRKVDQLPIVRLCG